MFIAAKYEEIFYPNLMDMVHVTGGAYTRADIARMEGLILAALSFSLTVPTPFDFLSRFLTATESSPLAANGGAPGMELNAEAPQVRPCFKSAGQISWPDQQIRGIPAEPARRTLQCKDLALYLLELTLTEYTMRRYLPSVLAAASLHVALMTLGEDTKVSRRVERWGGGPKCGEVGWS